MSGLPDLVLALQTGRGPGAVVVAHRSPAGNLEAGVGRWPRPVPEGALFLHWPRSFPWDPTSFEFLSRVREKGGEVLPLASILRSLGVSSPRSLDSLTAALIPEVTAIEDPALLGRRLLGALAGRLEAAPLPADACASGTRPSPELASALAALPDRPGVYAFHDRRGRALYVGKAASLRSRVPRHFGPRPGEPEKSRALAERARDLRWEATGSDLEAMIREQMRIRRERPPLNAQEEVHERRRGPWRDAVVLCVLPSGAPGSVEAVLVSGDGRFHWERLPSRPRVPRGFGGRLRAFREGSRSGWGPGEPGVLLRPEEGAALAEIALSWLARRGDAVSRIDLRTESGGRALSARVRRLLVLDPGAERVEVTLPSG